MNSCDDLEPVGKIDNLHDLVHSDLLAYAESKCRDMANDRLYGVFWKGMRLPLKYGKSVFQSPGQAKASLNACFQYYARNYGMSIVTTTANGNEVRHMVGHIDMHKAAEYQNELLKHVEIRELSTEPVIGNLASVTD